jgi:CTP synthase
MLEQRGQKQMGATMRLGAYDCLLEPGSVARHAYGVAEVRERHRHRYEFNNGYREIFKKSGMRIAGINPGRDLVEAIELPDHPWFVAVQYHPELRSRPKRPHPLFRDWIGAALARGHGASGEPPVAAVNPRVEAEQRS